MGIHDLGSGNGWYRHLGSTRKFSNNNNLLEKQVGKYSLMDVYDINLFVTYLHSILNFQFTFSAS